MKLPNWVFVFVLAGLAGCVLGPQTVALVPRVDVAIEPVGGGRSLALTVTDQRGRADFGARGGVYDTALITPRSDVAATVREALAERLRAAGFEIVPPGSGAPTALGVDIMAIDYTALGDPLVSEVRARAEVRATLRHAGRSLTGQYQASSARQVLKAPSEVENERIINEVLNQVLARLLSDPEMLTLLTTP